MTQRLLIPACAFVALLFFNASCGGEECGAGTVAVDGKCVPSSNLCAEGEAWADGACQPAQVGCSDGFSNIGGSCVA